MERIPVAAQRADADAVIVNHFPEIGQCRRILEHRNFAMCIAHIISSGEFDGIYMECCEFLENIRQRHLRQQGSEDSNAHKVCVSSKSTGSFYRGLANRISAVARAGA